MGRRRKSKSFQVRTSERLSSQRSNNNQTEQQHQQSIENHDISFLQSSSPSLFTSTQLSPEKELPIEYKNLMEEITKNIKQHLETWFLNLLTKQEEQLNKVKEANLLIENELEKQTCLNITLRKNIEALENKIEKVEQKLQEQIGKTEHLMQIKESNACVLSGPSVPQGKMNENCNEIVSNLISKKLNINLPNGSIMGASRLGYEKDGKPDRRSIRFNVPDEKIRSKLIGACIKMKPNFYINEYLTRYNKKLLLRALELKNNLKLISTCFVKQGILNVSKIRGSKTTKIFSFEELNQFLNATNIVQ
jgi:BMFP domain-containing protein YqiC